MCAQFLSLFSFYTSSKALTGNPLKEKPQPISGGEFPSRRTVMRARWKFGGQKSSYEWTHLPIVHSVSKTEGCRNPRGGRVP